jgi:hypothetical protein
MSKQVSLVVNGAPVDTDYFVAGFIDQTVEGMLRSLRGAGEIGEMEMAIDRDGQVTITLNNAQLPVNEFVNRIIRSTIFGMLSSLKGVDEISTVLLKISH